jgi:H/ACA ribonucleoprotein complex subunit 4
MVNIKKIKESKTTKELLEFGIINIDKPSGPTSFSVSEFVGKKLGLRKTSHFGTLDPKVTGVLPIALNRGCKLTGYFLGHDKEYVGIMRFHEKVSSDRIKEMIDKKFTGIISQIPPKKSRVKRVKRERSINRFEVLEENEDGKDFLFISDVQGGTYIRKLIDDLGSEMGVGAHMLELRRIRAGMFDEELSVNLYDYEKAVEEYNNGDDKKLREMIIPAEIVSEFYRPVEIKDKRLKIIFTGKPLENKDLIKEREKFVDGEIISVFCGNIFVGMYKTTKEREVFARPEFVMQPIFS